jgi:putative glycosyltransferase (TIGR04372 family)
MPPVFDMPPRKTVEPTKAGPAPSAALPPSAGARLKGSLLWLLKPVFLAAGLVLYAVIRILEPWKRVKVGMLSYDRIGELSVPTEKFLRALAASPDRSRVLPFFVSGPPANRQFFDMIRRRITTTDSRVALQVYFHGLLPFITGSRFHERLDAGGDHEFAPFSLASPQLSFLPDEEERGRRLLREIGVPEGKPFICFHARDKAYLDRQLPHYSREHWSYHDYRDCNVEDYLPAAQDLASRGLYALRMGSVVEQPIKGSRPGIVDYASRYRSDFGDIYLLARCKFFLCNTAGLISVATCFNIPVAAANYVPLGYAPWRPADLFIPKTYRARNGRDIPFRDIVSSGASLFLSSKEFSDAGITVVENSAEDIQGLSEEMDARIDGRWQPRPEDEELQRRFRALFPAGHPITGFLSRVGAEFLRRHKELLD